MKGGRAGVVARLFRLVLGVFPRTFRERFGPSMEQDFADQLEETRARGPVGRAARVVRALVALLFAGLRERLRPSHRRAAAASGAIGPVVAGAEAPASELFRQDLRFAIRSLVRRPGFTVVAVVTLALGIGANSAIFSVVDGVLLEPLPYEDPDGLMVLWQHDLGAPEQSGVLSQPVIEDVAELDAFRTMVGYRAGTATLTGMGEAELVSIGRVTDGLMETFLVEPVLGRDIRPEENHPDAPWVAVIGYGFWRERFGGDPGVLGRTVEVRGQPHTIVGVAPPGFSFPDGAQVWYAYRMDPEGCARGCQTLEAIGRLAPDVPAERAQAELDALAVRLEQEYPDSHFQQRFRTLTLAGEVTGNVRTGLWVILGAVGVVLLIACANVANLLLVRGASRRAEVAVRAALGASRRRLGMQVLLESAVLAVLGGAAGLVFAAGAVELLQRVSPGTIPRIDQVGLDVTVLLFTLATVVLVALLFGLSPAYHLSRAATSGALARSAGRGAGRSGEGRSRSLLLAAEVGLSVILLIGAGLLFRSFAELYQVELGYETEEVLRFGLVLPESRYGELEQVAGFYRELETRIAAIPGVAAVGSIFGAPLGRGSATGQLLVEGRPEPEPEDETYGAFRPVTPGYFETMRIPVLRGRGIEPTDGPDDVPVAVVNETVVRENFPGQDPLGQRIRVTVDIGFGSPVFTIVGIVPDIRSRAITRDPVPEVYLAHAQVGAGFQTVAVRGAVGVTGLLGPIRDAVRALDPHLPLRGVETMTEAVERQVAPTRFYLTLIGLFAALALLLAAVGLYGVVSYLVSQRTREIGVRMALGSGRAGVARLVVTQGLRPAIWGVVLGVVVSLVAVRVVESLLFGVAPRDPLVFVGVPFVLLGVVVLASLLPARRASRVDPVIALRAE